jgi:hypothetical protein
MKGLALLEYSTKPKSFYNHCIYIDRACPFYIPLMRKHCLYGAGRDVILLEFSVGDDQDIVRLRDRYGRI